jgi:hypothetical protein
MNFSARTWISEHKWRLLLLGIVSLLVISPISEVYNDQDNLISPLAGFVLLAVIFGTAENKWVIRGLTVFTLVWIVVAIATEGSGLFADASILAPVLFLLLLMAMFVLLSRWLVRAVHISTEVICAAVCGYLLLGILWMCLYAIVVKMLSLSNPGGPSPFVSTVAPRVAFGDLLYFSYTTLTTTGFGDIVPRAPVVRMLAVLEAMVGLFYNTIVIARFVGLYSLNPQVRKAIDKESVK